MHTSLNNPRYAPFDNGGSNSQGPGIRDQHSLPQTPDLSLAKSTISSETQENCHHLVNSQVTNASWKIRLQKGIASIIRSTEEALSALPALWVPYELLKNFTNLRPENSQGLSAIGFMIAYASFVNEEKFGQLLKNLFKSDRYGIRESINLIKSNPIKGCLLFLAKSSAFTLHFSFASLTALFQSITLPVKKMLNYIIDKFDKEQQSRDSG